MSGSQSSPSGVSDDYETELLKAAAKVIPNLNLSLPGHDSLRSETANLQPREQDNVVDVPPPRIPPMPATVPGFRYVEVNGQPQEYLCVETDRNDSAPVLTETFQKVGTRYRKKKYLCKNPECEKSPIKGGFCADHGGEKFPSSTCKNPECEKAPLKGGFCRGHGGTYRTCKNPECETYPLKGGFCRNHGGVKYTCKHPEGCEKSPLKGGFCRDHGGVKNTCKHPEGCEKCPLKGGLCADHGGVNYPGYYCKNPKCMKRSRKGGFCTNHGDTHSKKDKMTRENSGKKKRTKRKKQGETNKRTKKKRRL